MMMDYQTLLQLLRDVQNPSKVAYVEDEIKYRAEDPRFLSML